ncbi:hypothetical protein EYF80_027568 [Liparis tanakae]|uniref:Uncharacterized protein n=1 Tax=Liparis tanakae TaxID=230148 RepID=A0A4Z2H8H1_9TELE|nr:hypothetical protein EYF80_027568 [Liparis tanakae]
MVAYPDMQVSRGIHRAKVDQRRSVPNYWPGSVVSMLREYTGVTRGAGLKKERHHLHATAEVAGVASLSSGAHLSIRHSSLASRGGRLIRSHNRTTNCSAARANQLLGEAARVTARLADAPRSAAAGR